jgi:glutamate dehydrogenase
MFISGLLDITDNIVGGKVVPPPDVVRHDGDDPTWSSPPTRARRRSPTSPTRSPSSKYGFWLGDAFASGGSAGYDHKKMGITARGAWESVKRHFRELGVDTQTRTSPSSASATCPATCSATACCCREHIRLVAAFDHRHIFLDPTRIRGASRSPSASGCSTCRARRWADYDKKSLISEGGGVFPRRQVDPALAAGARGARLEGDARR